MPKYIVTISERKSTGMFRFQWQGRVEADDRTKAVERARTKMKEDGFNYTGSVAVEELRTYAVTIRGRKDGRRRETFYAEAVDEKKAISALRHNPSVQRFLYPSLLVRPADIVKIEVVS